MKKSINDQLIEIYYFVDEFSKHHPEFSQWRESNNGSPKFSDAEVITIALMQGYFGCATLSQTYGLMRANAGRAFPHLCSYKQWIARLHALSPLIGLLVLASSLRPRGDDLLATVESVCDRVFSRSWNGLWTTIKLKLFYLNLCLNRVIEA